MKAYQNLSGNSGVTHYKTGKDFIEVMFRDKPDIYIYSYTKTGKEHVDRMKILAMRGRGLSAYITQHPSVKKNFSSR